MDTEIGVRVSPRWGEPSQLLDPFEVIVGIQPRLNTLSSVMEIEIPLSTPDDEKPLAERRVSSNVGFPHTLQERAMSQETVSSFCDIPPYLQSRG